MKIAILCFMLVFSSSTYAQFGSNTCEAHCASLPCGVGKFACNWGCVESGSGMWGPGKPSAGCGCVVEKKKLPKKKHTNGKQSTQQQSSDQQSSDQQPINNQPSAQQSGNQQSENQQPSGQSEKPRTDALPNHNKE